MADAWKTAASVLEETDYGCEARAEPVGWATSSRFRMRPDLAIERTNLRAECRSHQRHAQEHPPGAILPA